MANLRPVGSESEPLRAQADLVLAWLTSPDAHATARGLVARYRLSCEGSDLIGLAWVRVSTSFSARTSPSADLHDSNDAARYGYRVLSNLAIDQVRLERRGETREIVPMNVVAPSPEESVITTSFFEELIRRVSVVPIRPGNCGGCSPDMLRSIIIRVVQSIASESLERGDEERGVPGRDSLDRAVDAAIGRVAGESVRVRKRHSRCKGCVRDILGVVIQEMEGLDG